MKRFVTSYTGSDGKRYGDHVDAIDFEHAEILCDQRGRGESVDGVLFLQIRADGVSIEKACELTRALAESGYEEPPDASEFENYADA